VRPVAKLSLLVPLLTGIACHGEGPSTGSAKTPFRFVDVAVQAGLDFKLVGGSETVDSIIGSIGVGGAWLDYDGDGDADLYLVQGATPENPTSGPPDRLFRNDGDPDGDGVPTFTDVTEAAGLGDRLWSFGAATADYDNDGDTDLFLTNWGPNRLYRNNGDGTFTDVAPEAGLDDERWGISAAWSDVDLDGDLDLYVTNYVDFDFDRYPLRGEPGARGAPPCNFKGVEVYCGPRNLEPQRDALFRNEGDVDGDGRFRFTDVTVEAGLDVVEPFFGIGVAFFDADNDGDDDLYVANDSVPNLYFVNHGDGTFEELAIISGLAYNEQGHEQAGMGIAIGDYDNNGRLDMFVTNFSHDHDTLYRNDGDLFFTDVSYTSGVGSPSFLKLGWGAEFVDLDQDGWEDLFVNQGHVYPQIDESGSGSRYRQRNTVFRNNRDGTFEDVTDQAGPALEEIRASRALLPVDLDGDGDVDLLQTHLNDRPMLLHNEGSPGNWLHVELLGVRSNRDGIGARVTVVTGELSQIREMRANRSFAGSTLPVAYFGIGDASRVDRLEVRWPSGTVDVRTDVQANTRILIEESGTSAGQTGGSDVE
jgi:hypothetical protein